MYKIAIAGCGMMANTWIEYALQRNDCQIVAFIDIIEAHAQEKNEKYQLSIPIYTTLKKAMVSQPIDIVFDITPPDQHFEMVKTALEGGCHVFGEKPMSDSLANSYKLVEIANTTGKEYFVMQNRRYLPYIYGFKKFLQSGELGNIGQLSANFQLNPHFGGFREDMESPLIADMAIHTFDAARFLLNKSPVSVYCKEFNPSWSWYKGDASAICIFEMEDGSIFDYRGCWCANGLNTTWESEWRASCEKGSALWDGAQKMYYEIEGLGSKKTGLADEENNSNEQIKEISPFALPNEAHYGCIDEMFESLKLGKRPQTDCRDNIKSIEMVFKAIESAKTNKVVMI